MLLTAILIAVPLIVTAKTNVVLILSDDLRAQLNVEGFSSGPNVPNLRYLSWTGHTFNHAYANQALCGPSRNSFLSGRRPQHTAAYNFVDSFRDVGQNWTTLPGLFKSNNYTTVGAGKVRGSEERSDEPPVTTAIILIPHSNPFRDSLRSLQIFHPGLPPDNDIPYSWDDRMSDGTWEDWMYPTEDACSGGTAWCGTTNETDLEDYKTTQQSLKLLDNVTKEEENPFFLAVGYRKPHLQWRVPQRVLDGVRLGDVTSPSQTSFPPSTPPLAYHMPVDDFLLEFSDVEACGSGNLTDPSEPWFSDECARLWRRGYYAAVEYMDEQVGIILDELRERGLEDNTIVAFFGDHGWHLGEWGMWEKFSNFEVALRTPMFIRAPGMGYGLVDTPVELVDVYKTLAELAGLELPSGETIDGDSMVHLMEGGGGEGDDMAFSQFPRCLNGENYANLPLSKDDRNVWEVYNEGDAPSHRHEISDLPEWKLTNCNEITVDGMDWMGLSVRTVDWRFTQWFKFGADGIDWESGTKGREELYRYFKGDVDVFDGVHNFENVVSDPAYVEVVEELRGYIKRQWGNDK